MPKTRMSSFTPWLLGVAGVAGVGGELDGVAVHVGKLERVSACRICVFDHPILRRLAGLDLHRFALIGAKGIGLQHQGKTGRQLVFELEAHHWATRIGV
jgi:hypothetical protein